MRGGNGFGRGLSLRGLRRPFYWSLWKTLDKGKLKFEYLQFLRILTVRFVLVVEVFWACFIGFR